MTSPMPSPQHTPFSSVAHVVPDRTGQEAGPYAQPSTPQARFAVDAVLIDAIRATVGPFVPEPWRTNGGSQTPMETPVEVETPMEPMETPATSTLQETSTAGKHAQEELADEQAAAEASVELPWIDAFLGADEDRGIETPVRSLIADAEQSVPEMPAEQALPADLIAATFATSAAESETAAQAETPLDAPAQSLAETEAKTHADNDPEADTWPMEEAGTAMRALTADIRSRTPHVPPTAPVASGQRAVTPLYVPPVASTPPLPMWDDDAAMDIMPVKAPKASPGTEPWATTARRESERAGNPEAAARALEALARKVRLGEIEVPGYSSEMGDAAALAAALAALLGVRR